MPDPSTTSTTAGTGKPLSAAGSSGSAAATNTPSQASKPQDGSKTTTAEPIATGAGGTIKLPIRQLADEAAAKAALRDKPTKKEEKVDEKVESTAELKSATGDSKTDEAGTGANVDDGNVDVAATDSKDDEPSKIDGEKSSLGSSANKAKDSKNTLVSKSNEAGTVTPGKDESGKTSGKDGAGNATTVKFTPPLDQTTKDGKENTSPAVVDRAETRSSEESGARGTEGAQKKGDGDNDGEETARLDEHEAGKVKMEDQKDAVKETKAETESTASSTKDTIKPQLQDAKSAEAAGVSNMD